MHAGPGSVPKYIYSGRPKDDDIVGRTWPRNTEAARMKNHATYYSPFWMKSVSRFGLSLEIKLRLRLGFPPLTSLRSFGRCADGWCCPRPLTTHLKGSFMELHSFCSLRRLNALWEGSYFCTYTRFRIYGPHWDTIWPYSRNWPEFALIPKNFTKDREIGTTQKLTKYPKRPHIQRPYNRNRV